jgi:NAD(P)-dependent dehydrogenase (short-subunit alcohol dehydrogenase family)
MRDTIERLRTEQQVALVIGTAQGLGAALARRFARAHMQVGLSGRNRGHLQEILTNEIEERASVHAIAGDATQPDDVERIFNEVQDVFGPPDLVVFNAAASPLSMRGGILDVEPSTFERAWRATCFAGFLVGRAAVRWMLARERGTIIFSDATAGMRPVDESLTPMIRPAIVRAGLQAVASAMAEELAPRGIHVAYAAICGPLANDGSATTGRTPQIQVSPTAVAEAYLHLHLQHRTAWTHHLDLRAWQEPS